MKNRFRYGAVVIVCSFSYAQGQSPAPGGIKEAVVSNHASGTFDVKLTPQASHDKDEGTTYMTTLNMLLAYGIPGKPEVYGQDVGLPIPLWHVTRGKRRTPSIHALRMVSSSSTSSGMPRT